MAKWEPAYPWQGTVWQTWHIACARCGTEDEMPTRMNRDRSVRRWRQVGWRLRAGYWTCPRCVEEMAHA